MAQGMLAGIVEIIRWGSMATGMVGVVVSQYCPAKDKDAWYAIIGMSFVMAFITWMMRG